MDLGCGTGRHSVYLESHGFKVYATDISEIGLKIAKSKADKLNSKSIEYKKHDMRDIPFVADNFKSFSGKIESISLYEFWTTRFILEEKLL